jgi:hypothetical protein
MASDKNCAKGWNADTYSAKYMDVPAPSRVNQPITAFWAKPTPLEKVIQKRGYEIRIKRKQPTWVIDDHGWNEPLFDDKHLVPTHWMPMMEMPA